VTEFDFCQKVYRRAYLDVFHWVNRWITDEGAGELASHAFVSLLVDACLGHPTTYGPYKQLFAFAELQMRHWELSHKNIVPFKVWTTVPVPTLEFLSELSRAYAITYQAYQLGQVTREERKLAFSMIGGGRFDPQDRWTPSPRFDRGPQVRHILGRVIMDLRAHVCRVGDSCEEYAGLWRSEELKSARWRADFLPKARENVHGY
jgi:hypothetical protein